jgi:hypothetical protein
VAHVAAVGLVAVVAVPRDVFQGRVRHANAGYDVSQRPTDDEGALTVDEDTRIALQTGVEVTF